MDTKRNEAITGESPLERVFGALRAAQGLLNTGTGRERARDINGAADAIWDARRTILEANALDIENAASDGMKDALIERLSLSEDRVKSIVESAKLVAELPDPLGRVVSGGTLPNGLVFRQVVVPLGVTAIIYESRPNVSVDAFAIAHKAGCAILLRGSSSALKSNIAIVDAIKRGIKKSGGIEDSVYLAASGNRNEVDEIIRARGSIDVVVPRGSGGLIRMVTENARVPVIETGEGNCHIYVEKTFDAQNAVNIILNAKLQRPGACNAVETVLIQKDAAGGLMPALAAAFAGKAELRVDNTCREAIGGIPNNLAIKPATENDYAEEFLDYILAIKTVKNVDEAILHINHYGTHHSDAILTGDYRSAKQFTEKVDSACVYVNASTRFTDGGEFGFGCELGISTQKFHIRGPMGVNALTSTKYIVEGEGQWRE
jgi:glutamate-5-semialdehyde dehydrogenase